MAPPTENTPARMELGGPGLGPYDQSASWESYKERLELWFGIKDVTEASKKKGYLLTEVGADIYETLKGLVMPKKLSDMNYNQIVAVMDDHYGPQKNETLERYNFWQRVQKSNESIAEFIAEIRTLSRFCEFAELEKMLRDRLVCGVLNEGLRKKLLAERNLTFQKAQEIAKADELARKGLEHMKTETMAPVVEEASVAKINGKDCFRCGKNHDSQTCWFKNKQCRKCGKTGHIAVTCRSTEKKTRKLKAMEGDGETSEEDMNSINVIGMCKQMIDVEIEGKRITMEVDSGASNSVMSLDQWKAIRSKKKLEPTPIRLRTWLKQGVEILGQALVLVKRGDKSVELSLIITKSGGGSLLGRNWFQPLGIYVHVPEVNAVTSQGLETVLEKHKRVFREELGAHTSKPVHIQLKENAQPVFMKHRQEPMARREAVGDAIDEMVRLQCWEPVQYSEWATPICSVQKPDGSWRICGDYRATVNSATMKNAYPLPTAAEILAGASGRKFSKIDMVRAYYQMLVDEATADVLTVNTHKGLYRVKRMPFGISAAPGIFQRFMDTLLAGIPGVQVFLDDILVSGNDDEEHNLRLDQVLERLNSENLTVNRNKCKFGVDEVEFVGFRITAQGIQPTNKHIKDILDAPAPQNQSELKAFLGMINFYARFIKDRATIAECLHRLIDDDAEWNWKEKHQQAMDKLKSQLVSAEVLMHYDMDLPLILSCDSSSYGVGAVLGHETPEGERPIAYFSRTLNKHQRNYAQIDKEALSIISAVDNFHQYISGRKIKIITDHQPLLGIFNPTKIIPKTLSPRMLRWCLTLSAYDYEIVYRAGTKHQNADALSRVPVKNVLGVDEESTGEILMLRDDITPVSAKEIQDHTKKDKILMRVKRWILEGWPERSPGSDVKSFFAIRSELSIMKDVVLRGNRVVVPEPLRERLLKSLHATHWGMVNMKAIARSYMWWPGMDSEIERTVRECERCQLVRNNPPRAPLCVEAEIRKPWERLHLDFAGPTRGKIYLIVVDSMSKWLEVRLVKSQSSKEVIYVLRGLFATHGVPSEICSDNGTAFVSQEIKKFYEVNGIRSFTISPWHPASNGQAEIMVQKTKKALLKLEGEDVNLKLVRYLFAQHTTPNASTGKAPCEILMGRSLKSCLNRLHPEEIKLEGKEMKEPRKFQMGSAVYVRNYAEGNRWVPAWVVKVTGPVSYEVQLEDGTVWRRHVNQMIARSVKNVALPDDVEIPGASADEDPDADEVSNEDDDEFMSASADEDSEEPEERQVIEPRPQRLRRPPQYLNDYDRS